MSDLVHVELVEARVGELLKAATRASTSGPYGTDSRIMSSVTSEVACSKGAGVGRTCGQLAGQALVRPQAVHGLDVLVGVRAVADLGAALDELVPAAACAGSGRRSPCPASPRSGAVGDGGGEVDRLGAKAGDEDVRRRSGSV